MRDIKFRAWDESDKTMIYNFNPALHCQWNIFLFSSFIREWGQYDLMQYTGLKDKNGKDAFIKDYVNVFDGGYCIGTYRVEWDDRELKYVLIDAHLKENRYEFDLGEFIGSEAEIEIIGNIFESPELLK